MGGVLRMTDSALEYYRIKYEGDVRAAFVHTVAELGDLARAIERDKPEKVIVEVTEIAALMHHLAEVYDFDLSASIEEFYSRKLKVLKGA
ncbi:MAG: hypothetical protein V3T26_01125 [candidate division NC10 bacterium]